MNLSDEPVVAAEGVKASFDGIEQTLHDAVPRGARENHPHYVGDEAPFRAERPERFGHDLGRKPDDRDEKPANGGLGRFVFCRVQCGAVGGVGCRRYPMILLREKGFLVFPFFRKKDSTGTLVRQKPQVCDFLRSFRRRAVERPSARCGEGAIPGEGPGRCRRFRRFSAPQPSRRNRFSPNRGTFFLMSAIGLGFCDAGVSPSAVRFGLQWKLPSLDPSRTIPNRFFGPNSPCTGKPDAVPRSLKRTRRSASPSLRRNGSPKSADFRAFQ